jgi:hypothetical protein
MACNGTDHIDSGLAWEVKYNGTKVASNSTPNGWQESGGNTATDLVAPFTATPGSTYEYFYTNGIQYYSFNFTVLAAHLEQAAGTKYLTLPNGSYATFTAPALPSSTNPVVQCTSSGGCPFTVQWCYEANVPEGYYVVTMSDGTVWTMSPVSYNGVINEEREIYNPTQITDRHGNFIKLNYVNGLNSNWAPALSTITDSNGKTLFSITRNNSLAGLVTQVSDCYGRSVYYTYSSYNLSQVSQIVATGTTSPPMRQSYTYTQIGSTYAITGITVPSPTGTGTSTTSFAYNSSPGNCTGQTDANGNQRLYTVVDSNLRR